MTKNMEELLPRRIFFAVINLVIVSAYFHAKKMNRRLISQKRFRIIDFPTFRGGVSYLRLEDLTSGANRIRETQFKVHSSLYAMRINNHVNILFSFLGRRFSVTDGVSSIDCA